MGVSKNRGKTPKWMVKIMENPIKMDDLGGPPLVLETPKCQPSPQHAVFHACDWRLTCLVLRVRKLHDLQHIRKLPKKRASLKYQSNFFRLTSGDFLGCF